MREVAKNAARETVTVVAVAEGFVTSDLSIKASAVEAVATKGVTPAATADSTTALSSAEQRKLDAQKRQQLAAQTRPMKRELEQNEQRMAVIETEKTCLESLLSTPISPAEIADAGRRLKALSDEVALLEERWLELTSFLEEATASTL